MIWLAAVFPTRMMTKKRIFIPPTTVDNNTNQSLPSYFSASSVASSRINDICSPLLRHIPALKAYRRTDSLAYDVAASGATETKATKI